MNLRKPRIVMHIVNGGICVDSGLLPIGNDLWFVRSRNRVVFLRIAKDPQLVSSFIHLSIHTI